MDDPTDTALAVCTGLGLGLCCVCALVHAWRTTRIPRMKESRSDTDLSNMLENAIPSASAGRRLTPPDDPDTP